MLFGCPSREELASFERASAYQLSDRGTWLISNVLKDSERFLTFAKYAIITAS